VKELFMLPLGKSILKTNKEHQEVTGGWLNRESTGNGYASISREERSQRPFAIEKNSSDRPMRCANKIGRYHA
jgi:hypothetical protein